MAIDTDELKKVYEVLMKGAEETIEKQVKNRRLDKESSAKVVGSSIAEAMQQAVHFCLQKPIIDEQITSSKADTAIKKAQSAKDLLSKDAQRELTQAQKDKIRYEINNVLPKQASNSTKQGKLLDKQIEKAGADLLLVKAQTASIKEQTIDNRKIKAIQVLGETFGSQAAGGLTVHADMWKTFFSLINDLATISIPTSMSVSKVSA